MPEEEGHSGSSDEDFEDDVATHEEGENPSSSHGANLSSPGQQSRPIVPMQKRRRVTRACDECRRKKIKCDGKQPCTHCTVYSYDCTFDQPSNRRRNPAPQYVEALENRLQRAETILKTVYPDVNLDDPTLNTGAPQTMQPLIKSEAQTGNSGQTRHWPLQQDDSDSDGEKDSMLESMVENTGSLDLDDDGYWDFSGHSSGRAFLRKMREQFGEMMGKPEDFSRLYARPRTGSHPLNSPATSSTPGSPMCSRTPNPNDLPAKRCAILLSENALNDACAVLRFIHQPSYWTLLDRIYDTRNEDLGTQELRFLPLLYSVIALGTVFATGEQSELVNNGFESAIDQGNHWFKCSRSMMDVTDCRDLTCLQTILCMIMFLQCSSRLVTCYSHIGIVLRSSIRMGLHRSIPNKFNPVEQETRKRIFFSVRKLDTYVGALLGLPKMLSDEDIDQDMPLEVDDERITVNGVLPMPRDRVSLMMAFNAHTRLVEILSKTVRYIYPTKGRKSKKNHSYIVSHANIREIEQDLQRWMEALPAQFKPGGPPEFLRIQHLLRMAYAHIEMYLYRPFLHYVSQDVQTGNHDKRSFACAAACVSVSRNIIHITGEMKRRGLLVGSYWFYMYTTYFAIISLIFYVLENPTNSTSAEILKDANEGKDTLAGLAKRSLAADKCSRKLNDMFEQLPEKLQGARAKPSQRKRQAPSTLSQPAATQSAPDLSRRSIPIGNAPGRANTSPQQQEQWRPASARLDNSPLRQQFTPHPDTNYRRASHDPYSPSNSISLGHYNINPTTGHGVPDLSAMMFPSADPFVYPNQPMTTLENRQTIKQENPMAPHSFMDSPVTSPSYDNLATQMFGGIPQYMISSAPPGFGIPQTMDGVDPTQSGMTMPGSSTWPQQQHHQQAGRGAGPPGMNVDQLFGEDWGGWMNQGYRQ